MPKITKKELTELKKLLIGLKEEEREAIRARQYIENQIAWLEYSLKVNSTTEELVTAKEKER